MLVDVVEYGWVDLVGESWILVLDVVVAVVGCCWRKPVDIRGWCRSILVGVIDRCWLVLANVSRCQRMLLGVVDGCYDRSSPFRRKTFSERQGPLTQNRPNFGLASRYWCVVTLAHGVSSSGQNFFFIRFCLKR